MNPSFNLATFLLPLFHSKSSEEQATLRTSIETTAPLTETARRLFLARVVILSAQRRRSVEKKPKLPAYPLPQVVGENEVPGERVGKGRVEFQHFLQRVPFDHVQVAVGQGPHVGTGLGQGGFLPEHISKHVSFP